MLSRQESVILAIIYCTSIFYPAYAQEVKRILQTYPRPYSF